MNTQPLVIESAATRSVARPAGEAQLRADLRDQPRQVDLRLKLLELLFGARRAGDFLAEARILRRQVPVSAPEWGACASMGRVLDAEEVLYSERGDTIAFLAPERLEEPVRRARRFGDDGTHGNAWATLAGACAALFEQAGFVQELDAELARLLPQPSVLQPARRLSARLGGAQLLLKREDLSGDDRHLLHAVAGQALIARRLGCKVLVTGTRDGRRGVITAHLAARLGMKAVVFMDTNDVQRHSGNACRVKLLGATLESVDARMLRNGDIREAALTSWASQPAERFLVMGLDAAPPPYPVLLRVATSAIGRHCRRQVQTATGRLPAAVIGRNGDTADALGMFPAFLPDAAVRLVCAQPAAAPPSARDTGDFNPYDPAHQPLTAEQRRAAQAILQALEYPSVRREHDWLRSTGRVEYRKVEQAAARQAIAEFAEFEGYIPPFETAHVLAAACEVARGLGPDQAVLAVVAERGDQAIWDIGRLMGVTL